MGPLSVPVPALHGSEAGAARTTVVTISRAPLGAPATRPLLCEALGGDVVVGAAAAARTPAAG